MRFHEWFINARERANHTQESLAAAAGTSRSLIYRIESGNYRPRQPAKVAGIAAGLKVSVDEFRRRMAGEAIGPAERSNIQVADDPRWPEIDIAADAEHPRDGAPRIAVYPPPHQFVGTVTGQCMEPKHPAGSRVIVQPAEPHAVPVGTIVFCESADGERALKRLVARDDDSITLACDNKQVSRAKRRVACSEIIRFGTVAARILPGDGDAD